MRHDQELVKRVAALRRSAPREFDEMLDELKVYSELQSRLCVQAPPDHLYRLQGRAQQCAELTTLFADACKTADRIDSKTKPSAGMALL